MLLMLFVSLYTSRVVLNVLGVMDFGIYNIVAGIVFLIGGFQSSLSNASQRYISVALGKEDYKLAEFVFRQSFSMLIFFSLIVLLVGETIGLWFLENKLVIPVERKDAAFWLYQTSLISIVIMINQVPMVASVISREKMSFYAYLGLFEAFAKLLVVYILSYTSSDRLVLYGFLLLGVSVITYLVYLSYCYCNFIECKFKWYWKKSLFSKMSSFVGYNFFGCFMYSATEQGINVALNLFFGPVVNAARGISMQISSGVTRFTASIMTAFQPSMIKAYASGDTSYTITLIEKCSKFSFFCGALLIFPIIGNVDNILFLWLGQAPPFVNRFTICILLQTLIGLLRDPLWLGANATGVIKNNQVYGRLLAFSCVPLSFLILLIYKNADVPLLLLVITNSWYWLYSLYDMRRQIGISYHKYFTNVVKPCLFLTIIMSFFVFCNSYFYKPDNMFSIVFSFFLLVLLGAIVSYFLLDKNERLLLQEFFRKRVKFSICKVI